MNEDWTLINKGIEVVKQAIEWDTKNLIPVAIQRYEDALRIFEVGIHS
jgi:hypothetical protein